MARRRHDPAAAAQADEAALLRRARLMLMTALTTVDGSPLWAVRRELERALAITGPRSARSLQPLADRVRAAEALLEGHGVARRVERLVKITTAECRQGADTESGAA